MSYTKYKTQGIVVGGSNVGEASRFYNIFTRDFGLIRVQAQGIREHHSKLKCHLQNLFLIDFYLVRGKNGWRVTEAYKIKSFPDTFRKSRAKLQSSTRILLFLKRMLGEQDGDRRLFDIITGGFHFMEFNQTHDVSDLETLIILRTLRNLGYVKDNSQIKALLSGNDYNQNLLSQIRKNKVSIVREINESIKASDL